MNVPVIMDITVAAILLGFFIAGARRGLFRSLAGLVIIVVALVGAGIFSATFTQPVAKYIQPYIEKRVEARIDAAMSGTQADSSVQMPELDTGDTSAPSGESSASLPEQLETQQLLKLLGIDGDPAQSISDSVQEKVRDSGISVLTAVVESVAESVIHILLFVLSFVVILILLKVLMHAMDLVLKLPGLHLLNLLGGAAIGLLEGGLCLFLSIWVLRRFGVSFETEAVNGTVLLHFFTTNSPLSVLSFLQS